MTEAEWEYAAKAGTPTPYPWGIKASHEYANYGNDTCCSGFASGRDQWIYTSPVGAFPPILFGLYDMNGNVLQYAQDCFTLFNPGLIADGSAYQVDIELKLTGDLAELNGKNSCSFPMVRGGDYGDPPDYDTLRISELGSGLGSDFRKLKQFSAGFPCSKIHPMRF